MPRSLLDQLVQIRGSGTYDDAVASPRSVHESQTSLQGDLNVLRTLLKLDLGKASWEEAPAASLNDLANKQKQYRTHVAGFEDVTVAATGSSTLFDTAIKGISGHNSGGGNSTTDGVIVDATSPHEVVIRDYNTQDAVNDGNGNDVYGRLSYDTTILETLDNNNQLSGYASITGVVKGLPSGNNTDVESKQYINIVDDGGGFFHVDIYSDAARTQLVGHTATYNSTGSQAVIADNASGLGGTITVDAVTAADSDIVIEHGQYVLTWYSWINGVETPYTFPATKDIEVASVPISAKEKDIPWSVYRTGEFHDVSGISGTILDDAVTVNGMTDFLVGLTTQAQVNARVDNLGTTNNGEGASYIGIEDASGWYTGTDLEAALNELETLLGSSTSSTYDFGENNVLVDNDAVYAALNKLDLKWGDLASTANGEGASLVAIEDSAGNFTATDVEGALSELYTLAQTATIEKEIATGVGPITAGTPVTIPNANTYTLGSGANMDVFVNGQLMVWGASEDYTETSTTQVTFTFTIPANSNITYLIRQ